MESHRYNICFNIIYICYTNPPFTYLLEHSCEVKTILVKLTYLYGKFIQGSLVCRQSIIFPVKKRFPLVHVPSKEIALSKDNKTRSVVLIVNTLNLYRLELKPISNRYFIIRKGVSFNVKRFRLGLKF